MKLGKPIKSEHACIDMAMRLTEAKQPKDIAFLSKICYPDGVIRVRFAIFDQNNRYQIFEHEYLNNIITN